MHGASNTTKQLEAIRIHTKPLQTMSVYEKKAILAFHLPTCFLTMGPGGPWARDVIYPLVFASCLAKVQCLRLVKIG
jgi:hypothetical protein